ncbi:MAG TPA: MazG nucleotide pyrophosphohydrolase domain-containing protein [Acidimicrobiales bacterium]|nr:MazG nucleotide pyrophosphohydrolase domain-containing protein [Acidimicrobiales bacterium]
MKDPTSDAIAQLAAAMRTNSERWFPATHDTAEQVMPLPVFYALGLAGEVGEVANDIKKLYRDGVTVERQEEVAGELADCFTYLLLLADELGADLVAEYHRKVELNEARWGAAA